MHFLEALMERWKLPTLRGVVRHAERQADWSLIVRESAVPDYNTLASGTLHEFLNDPANLKALEPFLANEDIRKLLTDKGVGVIPLAFAYNVLLPFAARQLAAQDGTKFTDLAFDATYEPFEDYLRSTEDKYRYVALLGNFKMETETERIGPFVVRRLTPDEYVAYNGLPTDLRVVTFGGLPVPYECLLERDGAVPRGAPPLTQTYQDAFWWFVAMMKVIHSGAVCYDMILVQPLSWSGMSFGAGTAYPRPLSPGKPYLLAPADLPALERYWARAEALIEKPPPFWRMALHRFFDGVDRVRTDEALIDYWIACESLFGEGVAAGELSYRLSLRIAHFLGDTSEERKRIRNVARAAYAERGRLLHGSTDLKPEELARQTSEMEDVTRIAIRKCLMSQHTSQKQMVNEIEVSILGGAGHAVDG